MSRLLAVFLAATLLAGAAHAQTREQKITELLRIQGLDDMLQETRKQSAAAAQQQGREAFVRTIASAGKVDPAKKERLEQILQRYLDRCATMWKPDEMFRLYLQSYGVGLSDNDLTAMLAYYRSPVGMRDVASTKFATRAFAEALGEENRRRLQQATDDMLTELKAELAR